MQMHITSLQAPEDTMVPFFSKADKEVAAKVQTVDFLFGSNFAEKCEAGKLLESASKDLQASHPSSNSDLYS